MVLSGEGESVAVYCISYITVKDSMMTKRRFTTTARLVMAWPLLSDTGMGTATTAKANIQHGQVVWAGKSTRLERNR